MAGDDDRSALLLADALNHVGDSHLGRWVEIVERLIQEKNLRIDDHRSDDANLLSVALREITEILLGSHDFIVHKALKLRQSLLQGTSLIADCAELAATEAKYDGIDVTFSPMVDLVRDARWGRVMESGGEDPYWGGEVGKATIRGYHKGGIACCVKHFAGYGAAEAGKE